MSMRVRVKTHKKRYPRWMHKDSPTKLAKQRDGNKCVFCGVADRTLITDEQGDPLYILYLHGGHLSPLDPWFYKVEPIEGERLRAMCPSCHRKYDLHWGAREEEVEHQRRMHRILLDRRYEGWIMDRFMRVQ
jgi:hypothetical protein